MQKMLFVAVLLCDFYANCADIMQIVLFLCKLWGFYANSAVLMQIVLFWCKLWHFTIYAVLSQMTFLSRNTRFNSRHFWVCYQAPITFNDVWLPPTLLQLQGCYIIFHWYLQNYYYLDPSKTPSTVVQSMYFFQLDYHWKEVGHVGPEIFSE